MRSSFFKVYLHNTTIKYTASELIKIKEWITLLTEEVTIPELEFNKDGFVVTWELKEVRIGRHNETTTPTITVTTTKDGMRQGEHAIITQRQIEVVHFDRDIPIGEGFIESSYISNRKTFSYNECVLSDREPEFTIGGKPFGRIEKNKYSTVHPYKTAYYIDGKPHGEVKVFWPWDGKKYIKKYVDNFVFGIRHGKQEIYSQSGKKQVECEYVFGEVYGEIKHYDDNGNYNKSTYGCLGQLVSKEEFATFDKKYGDKIRLMKERV